MNRIRRALLMIPFIIASLLTARSLFGDALHLRRHTTEEYEFLFAEPWAWLLDRDWFGSPHTALLENLVVYLVLLWIPATLYFAGLWMIMHLLTIGTKRRKIRAVP